MKLLVSRKNFIIITMMIVVLFGLIQIPLVMKDWGNKYDSNDYIGASPWSQEDVWKADVKSAGTKGPEGRYVVYIGSSSRQVYHTVLQWCNYSRRNLLLCRSVLEYRQDKAHKPEAILIDGAQMGTDIDSSVLQEWERGDVPIIFCTMPEASVIAGNTDLSQLFGIREVVSDAVGLAGIHVHSGFLLGGEAVYQINSEEDEEKMDLELTVPWYHVSDQAESYMVGIPEETSEETEGQPPLLWRYDNGDNYIFAVCGDYLSDPSGMGFLEAMMAEAAPYDIYPVVNAQVLSIVNFPGLSDENADTLEEIYGRRQRNVYQDIIWPDLITVLEDSGFVPTCFLTPKFDYAVPGTEASEETLVFYLKQMKQQDAEAGLSMKVQDGKGTLADKADADSSFFAGVENEYVYSAAYADYETLEELQELLQNPLFSGISTIVSDVPEDGMLLSYGADNVTVLGITHDAAAYRYSDDLRLRGYETALGYSNAALDMTKVVWPEGGEDEYQVYREAFSENLETCWKPYQEFDKLTATESDHRVRNFLALDFTQERIENVISVTIENMEDSAFFILRTHGEGILHMTGGYYTELEDEVYLIGAMNRQLEIYMDTAGEYGHTE